jgi:TfoX/Sxy family transcriptional regulator of competence genes
MAWVKVPAEHHPLFRAALPVDPRVRTIQMFGGVAALINGHIFGGLFARSIIVRLSPADHQAAMALDGAELFDPMGNGRAMTDTVLLPADVMDDPAELRGWLDRALEFTAAKPPKPARPASKRATVSKAVTKPAKPKLKPPTAKKPPAKRSAAKRTRRRHRRGYTERRKASRSARSSSLMPMSNRVL